MMSTIFVGVLAFLFLMAVIFKMVKIKEGTKPQFPYRKQRAIFTAPETSFYDQLQEAVGEHAHIFAKVRVANVVAPNKGLSNSDWKKSYDNISGQHFDFLLVSKKDYSVLCAIDFNGHPTGSKKRQQHDEFLIGVCQSVNIPFMQVTAGIEYTVFSLQKTLAAHMPQLRNALLHSRQAVQDVQATAAKKELLSESGLGYNAHS